MINFFDQPASNNLISYDNIQKITTGQGDDYRTGKLSSNVIDDSNDEINFPHKLLLTNTQVSRILKAFSNTLPANITFTKTKLSKIAQSGGFLGTLFGPLLKTGFPLMKNVFKLLVS